MSCSSQVFLLLLFRVATRAGWLQHGLVEIRRGAWKQVGQWLGSEGVSPLLASAVMTSEGSKEMEVPAAIARLMS